MFITVVILLFWGILFGNYWQSKRWKTFTGCISYENKNYKYSFVGKGNWQLISHDMGRNTSYSTAQRWGLVNYYNDVDEKIKILVRFQCWFQL